MSSVNKLTFIHPYNTSVLVSNMPFDESIELRNSDYTLEEITEEINELEEYKKFKKEDFDVYDKVFDKFHKIYSIKQDKNFKNLVLNGLNLGDGKMDYIQDKDDRIMMINAWQAITKTNTWNFISEDIDSFIWSNDPRINEICIKMEELGYYGHSESSFGYAMRSMQYLAQKGEESFKKLFDIKK